MFFRGQLSFLRNNGYDVSVVSSPGLLLDKIAESEKISCYPVPMERDISPGEDIFSLYKLLLLFRKIRPTIVHAHFPKGGILGVCAARMAQVPIIVYGMRGLRFLTSTGIKRKILWLAEWLSCRLADHIVCVSGSSRSQAIQEGFCQPDKIHTLGSGSGNGVNAATRFNPEILPSDTRLATRKLYHLPREALVVGYVGRVVRDKGIIELEEAWQILRQEFPQLYLLMAGGLEDHDPVPPDVIRRLQEDNRVRLVGWVKDSVPVYMAMDILVLPSYREGFPNTPLEAASMMLPVVASNIDGCNEAVVDGETGFLAPVHNAKGLAASIRRLLIAPELRREMGLAGRRRVLEQFQPEKVWEQLASLYESFLQQRTKIN